ncbi:MAG: hypothetical protein KKA64_04055 [Nanoarchaeota archaeon]|nr:hypothetical protein [Nanoarchaeota archaeon]
MHQEVLDLESLKSRNIIKKEEEKGSGFVNDENVYATYNHECKKCGYDRVQVIDMGIFISDEDNFIFIKCGKCGFSERVGRRTG